MIVSFPSKQSATEFAEQNGLTAHRRAYDDQDGPAGSWYVVTEESEESEKHE
jgi:hypothetical protein